MITGEKFYRVGYSIEEWFYVGSHPTLENYHVFTDKHGDNIEIIHMNKIEKELFKNVDYAISEKITSQKENYPGVEEVNGIRVHEILRNWYDYLKTIYQNFEDNRGKEEVEDRR